MHADIQVLCLTAASIGFFHTLTGPDHYLPFIAMAKARDWSWRRTALITFLCAVGHVGSSVVLGLLGIGLGAAVDRVMPIESGRGEVAAWLLIAFGLLYMVWGLRQAWAGRPHCHSHFHGEEGLHTHDHDHLAAAHAHVHEAPRPSITPWVLFTVFVFGPCEPLIPILMYPAATHSLWGLGSVTLVFFAAAAATMLAVVGLAHKGLSLVSLGRLDRWTHALAGGSITLCGLAIVFLGL